MSTTPPTFQTARNRRQKARTAGMHPDYWYPVELSDALRPGKVVEAVFWGKSFAVFRDEKGAVHALENRCAHRSLKLSIGRVDGCRLTCPYHGWAYDGDGKLVDIPHELFGHDMPKISIASYPTRERYGLVWIFPGDPKLAETTAMPEIPELEGPDAWACVPIVYTLKSHFSMILENVCDFTHEALHRRWQPFKTPRLVRHEEAGDKIFVDYDTKVGAGPIYDLFIARDNSPANHMKMAFDYPHQWSNTDGKYKHWMFVLPIDERTTKTFFLFYYEALKVPFLPLKIPRALMKPILHVANAAVMRPLLAEDGWAVEAEQIAWEEHYDAPAAEFSPVVKSFQALMVRKWEEWLAKQADLPAARRLPIVPSDRGTRGAA